MGQTRLPADQSLSAAVPAPPDPFALIAEWNRTEKDYPRHLCVQQLIEAQAERTPEAIAVVCQGNSLTYAELNARANQLARHLRALGVSGETLVALALERSEKILIALLAILKSGGTYVPLDPAYPRQRVKDVLEDAHIRTLITEQRVLDRLPERVETSVCLDRDRPVIEQQDASNLDNLASPESLAYVIYTSGSTGKPKGVQLEHRAVVNFLTAMQHTPGIEACDVLVAVTTLCFDIAGLEMYLPLTVGARVVIAPREATLDGRRLANLLREANATVMQATPATWRMLLESGWRAEKSFKVLCGGEALPAELARRLIASGAKVWNLYGPTETTIWSSVHLVTDQEQGTVPIGRPIANTSFYILDGMKRPVPVGAEGELYIGGDGLARGYFERPELTKDKFVIDPFKPGARLYRTGDLARYRSDGVVEFLGRIDQQVKIRGFRIELGEIEAVLDQHGRVRHTVVVARPSQGHEKRLIAYVVAHSGVRLAAAELRAYLEDRLPDYMVPSAFVQLEEFPLTPNGKVDRKALPEPRIEDFAGALEYVPPRNEIERRLVRIWERVLDVGALGVKTNLLELGIHSLQVADGFMKMSKEFGRDLPLALLAEARTIEQLARRVCPGAAQEFPTLVRVQTKGSRLPLFCVHGGAGTTLYLHNLARHLGSDQPIYGLESEGLDGRRIRRRTVEQMAAHYIAELRTVQSRGPYLLGGYCFGGIVAFEMARQLTSQGETVALVALMNAPLRFNRHRPAPVPVVSAELIPRKKLRGIPRLRAAAKWRGERIRRTLLLGWESLAFELCAALGLAVPQSMRTRYVLRMTEQAERTYRPQAYSGHLSLFRGRGVYDSDPELGWSDLAREGLRIYDVGDNPQEGRREMITEPVVGKLAQQLKTSMMEATVCEAAASEPLRTQPGRAARDSSIKPAALTA